MGSAFALVLHTHLPMVLNHGRWPHGSDWLCEAAFECYLPLLETAHRLVADGISPKWTINLSPILTEQLASPEFQKELRRGELLREDRGEVDRPLGRDTVGDEAMGRFEQRQVALERRLAEPIAAVRPPPVIEHHREVSVQNQRERRAHRWLIGAYERAGRKRS